MELIALILAILSLIIGLGSIMATLLSLRADINRKLDVLLERQAGVLTLEEAQDLASLYIKAIQRELAIAVRDYLRKEFPTHREKEDKAAARSTVLNTAGAVIANTRSSVRSFQLKGEQTFKEFLDQVNPVNGGIIRQAIEDTIVAVTQAIDASDPTGMPSAVTSILEDAGRHSETLLHEELKRRYSAG
ncbi:MAG: hypothetical protein ABIK65_05810 [Candidatus Eisenbacteria bacterium]